MTAPECVPEHVAPLPDPGEGDWALAAASVSAAGEGVFLFSGPPPPRLPERERRRARRALILRDGAAGVVDVPEAGLSEVRWRPTPIAGSRVLAVASAGDPAVFGPQYGEAPERFHLAVLGPEGVTATLPPTVGPRGGLAGAHLVGPGPHLHALGPDGRHRGSVEDPRPLADAVRPGVPRAEAERMGWTHHAPGRP